MLGIHRNMDGRRPARRPDLQHERSRRMTRLLPLIAAASVIAGGLSAGIAPAAVAAAPLLASTTAGPNNGFQFSVEPYTASGAQQRSDFSYQLQPGHQILDQFVVKNTSKDAESFLVYGEDATNVAGTGGYAFQRRAQMHNTTVGVWVTVGTTRLTVPTGKEAVVTFRLSIPANATPGDHVGGVAVEELKAPAQQNAPVGVNVVLRDVVPMYVHVVGPSYPGLTIENLTVSHQSPAFPFVSASKVSLSVVLVNTGNDILNPQSVTVSIAGGLSGTIHKYTVHQTGAAQSRANPLPLQMLPGAKLTLTEEWTGIPPFDPLTGHVSATAIDSSTTQQLSTRASTAFWYFPWIVVLIGLVLVAGLVALMVMRRRRKAAAAGVPPQHGGESGSGGPPLVASTPGGAALKGAGR